MTTKKVVEKEEAKIEVPGEVKTPAAVQEVSSKRKFHDGIVHIEATYNNTLISISDVKGNVLAWSSAGSLGFKGSKKATPYAAARVAEVVSEKVKKYGLQDVAIYVKGVGSGRESAIRAILNHGLQAIMIKDVTPLPHNGPRAPKPRRI
jgi:small subunit ribosomal protein S11